MEPSLDVERTTSSYESFNVAQDSSSSLQVIEKVFSSFVLKPISRLLGRVSATLTLPLQIGSLLQDCLLDGRAAWKAEKYRLGLAQIGQLLAVQTHSASLEDLKHELNSRARELSSELKQFDELTVQILTILQAYLLSSPLNDSLDALKAQNAQSRQDYHLFMKLLRQVSELSLQYPKEPAAKIIQMICHLRFTAINFYPFCETLIVKMLAIGYEKLHQKKPDLQEIDLTLLPFQAQIETIQAVPQIYKAPHLQLSMNLIEGALSIRFDPQRLRNLPYLLYTYSSSHYSDDFNVIRSGTPTAQRTTLESFSWAGEATINPEFKVFIKQTSTLYFSLQDDQTRLVGNEKERNLALKELENEFPKHFFFCVLANDSSFYHQKDEFGTSEQEIESFRVHLMHEMLEQPNGYYFSSCLLNRPEFKLEVNELFNAVHSDFFNSKLTLTNSERKDFIEAFHTYLILHCHLKLGAKNLMLVCKDGMDRAGKANALLQALLLVITGQYKDPAHRRALFVYLHAAPLLIKKKIINERRSRFFSVYERLNNPTVQTKIVQRYAPLQIKRLQLPI